MTLQCRRQNHCTPTPSTCVSRPMPAQRHRTRLILRCRSRHLILVSISTRCLSSTMTAVYNLTLTVFHTMPTSQRNAILAYSSHQLNSATTELAVRKYQNFVSPALRDSMANEPCGASVNNAAQFQWSKVIKMTDTDFSRNKPRIPTSALLCPRLLYFIHPYHYSYSVPIPTHHYPTCCEFYGDRTNLQVCQCHARAFHLS